MQRFYYIFIALLCSIVFSCSIEPSKIEYGTDGCHYCKMTIVERTHAAQIVTNKGKDFKYDAIECLLYDIESRDLNKISLFLVTDYLRPSSLVDAKTATYLVSESIQSPMGANLTAFSIKEKAKSYAKNVDDKIFSWEEIQQYFSK